MKAKRKTLNAGDVLAAMEEMEFERFLEPLREALEGQFISKYDKDSKLIIFLLQSDANFPR